MEGSKLSDLWKKRKSCGHIKRLKQSEAKNVHLSRYNSSARGSVTISAHQRCETVTSDDDYSVTSETQVYVQHKETNIGSESTSFAESSEQNNVPNFPLVVATTSALTDTANGESEANPFIQKEFVSDIRCWAIRNGVNHTQLRDFLVVWNKHVPFAQLPRDPRTLLKTPRNLSIISDPVHVNEKYWYYGLTKSLLTNVLPNLTELPSELKLNFNADGLPISQSSKEYFWPLLYNIYKMPHIRPLVISIFHGKSK